MKLTLEQIQEFFRTEEGQKVRQNIITDYIQNDETGAELLKEIMAPEIVKAKTEAVQEWETSGKGKALKDKNADLLSQIATGKEGVSELKKYQTLLDISPFTDYNELEKAILSHKKDGSDDNEELASLRASEAQSRIRLRELENELKDSKEAAEKLDISVKDSDSFISNLLIHNEIKSTLLKEGFDEHQAQGLVYRINQLGNFKVEKDEFGDRKAVNEAGLTPEIYTTKEYLVSSEGKAFKPNKAGGGGAGNDLPGGGGTKKKNFGELSWGERNKWKLEDPDAYNKARSAHIQSQQGPTG
jgi:hypothetical protein